MPNGDKSQKLCSHTPVLLDKVIEFMNPSPDNNFIDLTTGPGSMSRALLEHNAPGGRVLSIDCDPRTQTEQESNLSEFGERSIRRYTNFSNVLSVGREEGFTDVDGILGDLDVSSIMLDSPDYGMSIRHKSRLDMRFDPALEISAYDLVNTLPEKEIESMLRKMDEIRFGGRIAKAIIIARSEGPIETTGSLAEIVSGAIPRRYHPAKIHPATKTFLAIRERVNSESESLEKCLKDCVELLKIGGVLLIICYSSFEDRIVKAMYSDNRDRWERLTKKAIRPEQDEIAANPRSRSARLRAYRKIA
ncbi:MAG: 16S rRNA (cytosine(1402)-N(4))-methyltransferase RsmH [bacterium]|nr:16S rRNA (cytosine(1402)-N(4))-methyltransferase RsmH [bacterium]